MKTSACPQTPGYAARRMLFRDGIYACILFLLLSAGLPSGFSADPPENSFPEKTVTVPVGNMHIRPAESASVVDTLKQGDRIAVIGREGEWYMARLPDQRLGWVHESLFQEIPRTDVSPSESPASSPPPEPEIPEPADVSSGKSPAQKDFLFEAEVRISSARVRENPSFSSDVDFGLEKGEKVSVTGMEKDWYHIRTQDGRTGWAFRTLFRVPEQTAVSSGERKKENVKEPQAVTETGATAPETPVPSGQGKETDGKDTFQAVTKVEMVRIRETPSFDATVLFRMKKGDVVTVTEVKQDWFHIQNEEGKSGWAHHLHFSRVADSKAAPAPVIGSIRFETDSEEAEKVVIALNAFHPPDETFPLDEEIPKVVCDFREASVAEGIEKVIPVNGKLIRTIRLGIHKGSDPKVRVVVDLDPRKKYTVEQVFFKKNNLYTLTFKPIPGQPANKDG